MRVLCPLCLIVASGADNEPIEHCPLVQALIPGYGVGVFAGKDFVQGETVELSLGIPAPMSLHAGNLLDNYVEGYNEKLNLVTLGWGMIYNHAPAGAYTIDKHLGNPESLVDVTPFDVSDPDSSVIVRYFANRKIQQGDQILNYYGENWFSTRQVSEMNACDESQLHCRIDLISSKLILPGCPMRYAKIFKGTLIATRAIASGTVVEVSRALFLPLESLTDAGNILDLLWYLNQEPQTESELMVASLLQRKVRIVHSDFGTAFVDDSESTIIGADGESANVVKDDSITNRVSGGLIKSRVLLPLGWGALYSPRSPHDEPNIEFSRWTGGGELDNCQCGAIFIAFKAKRDIRPGELLTVDLKQVSFVDKSSLVQRRIVADDFAKECF